MIRTERLVLRPFTAEDLQNLVELDSDPDVVRYAEPGLVATPENRAPFLERYRARPDQHFAAEEDGAFVGWFFLRDGELGYRLKRSAWGRGLATEGASALLERAGGPVWAEPYAENAASVRVLAKLGFRIAGERGPLLRLERP